MSRPPQFLVEDKLRIVLSVWSGEVTIAEAAGRNKTGEQSVGRWRQRFIEGGKAGLAEGGRLVDNPRQLALLEQIGELTAALGEAHAELRVWKKSVEYRLAPSRTSR